MSPVTPSTAPSKVMTEDECKACKEEIQELCVFLPGKHGVALDDLVGLLAAETGFD